MVWTTSYREERGKGTPKEMLHNKSHRYEEREAEEVLARVGKDLLSKGNSEVQAHQGTLRRGRHYNTPHVLFRTHRELEWLQCCSNIKIGKVQGRGNGTYLHAETLTILI